MNKVERGFGLVEVIIAVALGIVVVLGITQIFASAKQSYLAQDAASRLQEEARYVLSRMVQDIRMAGMFGCLPVSLLTQKPSEFDSPIEWNSGTKRLGLITASVADGRAVNASSTWTIITDCRQTGAVTTTEQNIPTGELAFPIRKLAYIYSSDTQTISVSSGDAQPQPLVSGVSSFSVDFGLAADAGQPYVSGNYVSTVTGADSARIRSVRLSLTMTDADGRAQDQRYKVVAALRNRLP